MRNILITGANGGLGLAIAKDFLDREPSSTLWLGVRQRREDAATLASSFPGRAHLLDLDVSDPNAWECATAAIHEASGKPAAVLINNAGHHHDALLATMDDEAWLSVIHSNLFGTFFGCRAVAKGMLSLRGGRIINVASLSALAAPAGQANYAAAKAAVLALTSSLAKELARARITVNALCPGYIDTATLAYMDGDARARARASIPMRRFGKPEEVAAAVRFLASDDAAYITGATLKIDGGIL
jgi:3-oxoacyl-[acyl-carrier protein] reductase